MAQPREEYKRARQRLNQHFENAEIAEKDYDAIVELCDAYDEEAFQTKIPHSDNGQQESYREPYTLANWARTLQEAAREFCLVDADAEDVNGFTQQLLKEKGLQRGTVRGYQSVLRRFYDYHDGTNLGRTDVHRLKQEDSPVDPADMLTEDEIHELRQSTDHARDLAMLDMLLYTGQRSLDVRTIRIKDADLENNRFKLNDTVDGLKGANDHIKWRSLLLAESSVSEWVNKYHPHPKPDHYLFCGKGTYNDPDATSPLTRGAPQSLMNRLKKRAGIEKPLHPHMLRHNFVNLAINQYDLDPQYVKLYIGHSPKSRVMESTYQHFTDEDISAKMEQGFDVADDEEEDSSPLTPSQCPRCAEPLKSTAKACGGCGLLITPDAQSAQNDMREEAEGLIPEVRNETEAEIVQDILERIRENPEEYLNE